MSTRHQQIIGVIGILLLIGANVSSGIPKVKQASSAHPWEKQMRADLDKMAQILTETLKPWPVPDRTFRVEDFGALADGKTLNTIAIQKAIDSCSSAGGGTVLFSRGEYVTGTIDMKSGVMLEITRESKILGSIDLKDYPDRVAKRKTVMDTHWEIRHSLIFAEGVERIGLRGPGSIDCRGTRKNFPGKESITTIPGRPFGMRFLDSRQIVVENIHLKDAASWMITYLNCEDIILQKINMINHCNWNNDGADIDGCRRVIVRECYFHTHDDAMCFKGTSLRPTEDVLIENSTFYSKCNSLKIGTDTQGDFRRILARNLVLGGPPKDLPTLDNSPTETGITLATVDGGDVEDILITNVTIDRATCPVFIRVGSRGRLMPGMPEAPIGKLRRVVIENVKGNHNGQQGSFISGIENGLIEDVVIRKVDLGMSGGCNKAKNEILVEENEKGYPDAHQFSKVLPAYGFWIRHASNIYFYDVNVTPANPDTRPPFATDRNTNRIYLDGNDIAALPALKLVGDN